MQWSHCRSLVSSCNHLNSKAPMITLNSFTGQCIERHSVSGRDILECWGVMGWPSWKELSISEPTPNHNSCCLWGWGMRESGWRSEGRRSCLKTEQLSLLLRSHWKRTFGGHTKLKQIAALDIESTYPNSIQVELLFPYFKFCLRSCSQVWKVFEWCLSSTSPLSLR